MAIIFDATNRRIILDSATVTVSHIFSRWEDWVAQGDNIKYLPAFRTVGGDALLIGLDVPFYFFLTNGWRIRPMEADHTLVIDGNLFVDGGGDPIVPTLGNFNVLIRSVVPMQAQVVQAAAAAITPTDLTNIAGAVWSNPFVSKLLTVAKFLGLK
jgi:hypothetical protein